MQIRIVGGSLAGLFAGVLLQRAGHDVKIYERSAHGLAGRGAGLVAQQDLFRILRLLGCEHVARIGVVAGERIYFDLAGNVTLRFPVPQTQVSWDLLFKAAASRLHPGTYLLGQAVAEVDDGGDGATLTFADGRQERADLVIGADGIGSVVRQAVNPDDNLNRFAGYVAWRGLIPETALPETASVLLDRFAFYITHGAHALGYLVPGQNGETAKGRRRYNWVWYRPVENGALSEMFTDQDGRTFPFSLPRGALSPDRLADLHDDARAMLPPQFADAVEAEDKPSIQGIFDYQAPRMTGRSVALVGDAAFVVRPHTAMGLSKAAGDVMALARSLASQPKLGAALHRYEEERLIAGRYIADYGLRLGNSAL